MQTTPDATATVATSLLNLPGAAVPGLFPKPLSGGVLHKADRVRVMAIWSGTVAHHPSAAFWTANRMRHIHATGVALNQSPAGASGNTATTPAVDTAKSERSLVLSYARRVVVGSGVFLSLPGLASLWPRPFNIESHK